MSHISDEENEALNHLMSTMEVRADLWSLGEDKVLEFNGFPPLFFYLYWPIIGRDMVQVVQVIFESRGLLEEWKKMMITFILKRPDASFPSQFRSLAIAPLSIKCVLGSRLGGSSWLFLA